jgi:hypothetical protein
VGNTISILKYHRKIAFLHPLFVFFSFRSPLPEVQVRLNQKSLNEFYVFGTAIRS